MRPCGYPYIPREYLHLVSAEDDSVICTMLLTKWDMKTIIVRQKFEELVAARDNRDFFDKSNLLSILVCMNYYEI